MLDGVPVSRAEKSVYICLNKPRDVICTSRDPRGRRTVQDLLPELDVRIYNVGRLDRDSEGLLLLTNDGALTQRMTHPRYHLPKIYRIWTREPLTADACRQLEAGIQHRGQCLRAARAGLLKTDRPCCEIELREGRNRQIRRMFEALGHDIQRLRRIRIGPLELGALRCGQWRYLRKDEIRRLRTATGLA
jgi:23S rRNA pseudouridine2605 synthase